MADWLRPLGPGGRPPRRRAPVATTRDPISFERAVERFAEHYISRRTGRPFSATSRRNVLDNLLGSPLSAFRAQRGIKTIEDWNSSYAAEYLRWLQNDLRRDSATIKKVLGQLRSFGEFCDREFRANRAAGAALRSIRVSAAEDFDRPKDPPLTREEVDVLLTAALTPRDQLAISMLLYTGMRPSELVALDATHVHLERDPPMVTVGGSVHDDGRPKGAQEPREIPLTIGQTLLPELIRAHFADPHRPAGAGALFLSKRADAQGRWQSLSLEGLRAMLFDLGQATGIRCHAYRLRHTLCTWCAEAGLPMADLQSLLGLKNSDMVAEYYRRTKRDGVLESAARLRF